jgi:hypothetical protein
LDLLLFLNDLFFVNSTMDFARAQGVAFEENAISTPRGGGVNVYFEWPQHLVRFL